MLPWENPSGWCLQPRHLESISQMFAHGRVASFLLLAAHTHPARALAPLTALGLSVERKPGPAGLQPKPRQGERRYLAVSECEVTGASQCRKGTLCSWMCMSYRPWGEGTGIRHRTGMREGFQGAMTSCQGGIQGEHCACH